MTCRLAAPATLGRSTGARARLIGGVVDGHRWVSSRPLSTTRAAPKEAWKATSKVSTDADAPSADAGEKEEHVPFHALRLEPLTPKVRQASPLFVKMGQMIAKVMASAAVVAVASAAAALFFPDVAVAADAAMATSSSSSFLASALSFIIHLDKHLVQIFTAYGVFAYGILFLIVFCETGLVVAPFLPGDSLLFATGALGAAGVLNFPLALGLLFAAAVLGDTVNYTVGSWVGGKVIEARPDIFKPAYIKKTKAFYEKHGARTVVLARFFVIVRTFAPFVAGVAKMQYAKFLTYNVVGGGVWVASFMFMGYYFGQIPVVRDNFALTIMGIVVLSLIPVILEIFQQKKEGENEEA